MGRKMGLRGRPGLFFIIILVIFLGIFFLTWRTMMSPKRKVEVKDVYSMNFQSAKHITRTQHQPQSDLNDIWHRANQMNSIKLDQQEADKEDYHLKNPLKLDPVVLDNVNKAKLKSPLSSLLHATKESVVVKPVETKPYYQKPDESLKIIGGRMERFVHLDLKGAAPKLSYFKQLFPLFSRLGATGLLIEYEDMFPYSGKLEVISAENSYTRDQVKELLELASLNSLQVIPLIQTFGHMEFVLKALHLKSLRESEYTPQVIDITSNSSYSLIQGMVEQVLSMHPGISYLHIGCDEVYEIGRGKSANVIVRERVSTEKLFLRHVKRVTDIVATVGKNKVRPIIWDDELRSMAEEDIVSAGLPAAVDIMVWRYTQNISDKLTDTVWKKYAKLFKSVWAASSFKGATGPRQVYTEPQYHIINHFSWINTIAKYGQSVSFKGIALTGWQRFDHFATLCELLPVAIPSLAVCLASIKNGGFDEEVHKTTSKLLTCSNLIDMSFPVLDLKERRALISQDCRFPGSMVYYGVQQLWGYKQFQEKDRRSGWLSDYQVNHGFTNPGQLKVLSMRLYDLNSKLLQVREPLESQLKEIYSSDTVDEWLEENIFEMQRELKGLQERIKGVASHVHWARRPNLSLITSKPPLAPVTSSVNVKSDKHVVKDLKGRSLDLLGGSKELNEKMSQDERLPVKVPAPVTLNSNLVFHDRHITDANDLKNDSGKKLDSFKQIHQTLQNNALMNRNINSKKERMDANPSANKLETFQQARQKSNNFLAGDINSEDNKKMASNVERLSHKNNPSDSELRNKENSLNLNRHAEEVAKPFGKNVDFFQKNANAQFDNASNKLLQQGQNNVIADGKDHLDHVKKIFHKQDPNNEEANMNGQIGLGVNNIRDPVTLRTQQNKDTLNKGTLGQFNHKIIPAFAENRNDYLERNGNGVVEKKMMKIPEKDGVKVENHISEKIGNNLSKRKGNVFTWNDNNVFEKTNNEIGMSRKSTGHDLDDPINRNFERTVEKNEQKGQGDNRNFLANNVKIDNQGDEAYEDQDDEKNDALH